MTESRRLTWRGFQRKQRPIALQMLAQHGIRPDRLRLISSSTNFIYRVTAGRVRYVLRLAFPGWRSVDDAHAETAWLEALSRDTDIPVPRILRTKDDQAVAQRDGRHAVLMDNIPGILLGKKLTEPNLRKMGALFAKLHLHAADWQLPPEIPQKTFRRFLSRGEPELVLTDESLGEGIPHEFDRIRRMAAHVNESYAALDPSDLRVIHCDLWHDNIKLHRGTLRPFDFEDTIVGFRLHDIAMAMLDLAEETDTDTYYSRLLPAFREGYENLLSWPDGSLETLQMGRVLWRLNWVGRHQRSTFADAARFNTALFDRFEKTGRLVDPLRS